MKNFDRKRLVGSWQLRRWFITYEDGSVTEPLGPGATGPARVHAGRLDERRDDGGGPATPVTRQSACGSRE